MAAKRARSDDRQLINNLVKDFHALVTNKPALRKAMENFISNCIDELTLGIIFDVHRKFKTNVFDLEAEDDSDDDDVQVQSVRKTTNCVCPICGRSVGAAKFASHLANCMGMGRTTLSRRVVKGIKQESKDETNSGSAASDNDDDDDWSSRNKKKKKKKHRNGSKKVKGPSKKLESMEIGTVDVEGDEDDLTILRVLHLQDEPSGSSYMETNSPSGSSSRRSHKSKMKKGKRDKSLTRFSD